MKIEDILEKLVGGVTKPAQTRIKQVTCGDDSVVYIPQHKCWGIWCNFSDYEAKSCFRHTNPYWCQWINDDESLEGAKKEIDYYLFCFNNEQLRRERKRLLEQEKEVTYIKYP